MKKRRRGERARFSGRFGHISAGPLWRWGRRFNYMTFSRTVRLFILLLVLGCAAGCDQTSKHFARSGLDPFSPVTLPGGFAELQLAENPGSFLSLGESLPSPWRQALFTVGTGVCLLGLFAYLVYKRVGRYYFIGLALIWAGGTSNLIDRITRHGLVTDFLFIRVGPLHTGVFNVADVMVMLGVAVLFYEGWKGRSPDAEAMKVQESRSK